MSVNYQPFPIKEEKSGLFNYLKPWIRPIDAFDPLEDAYIYRGVLQRRPGYIPLGINGRMSYKDYLTTGTGIANYSGVILTHPIVAGSLIITAGVQVLTDQGNGTLTGNGTGTINYTTGAWSVVFNAVVNAPTNIYAQFSPNTSPMSPIMGLKLYTNESTDLSTLVALDTKRASSYNNNTELFVPINTVSQTLWVDNGTTMNITLFTGFAAIAPYTQSLVPNTVTISYPGQTMTDNGAGGFAGAGAMTNLTTVNYGTGVIVLDLNANLAGRVFTVTFTLQGDYFTGNYSNFFNSTNWLGELYLTNNKDQITLYNGSTLSRPPFSITQAHFIAFTNDIGTCLDVDVYKNRLLVQRPVLVNQGAANGLYAQSIRWSAVPVVGSTTFIPTNLVADVSGQGGELSAPTDDFLQSSEFLRDQLMVFFTNTVWSFRFTGSDFSPFRFDKINNTKNTNAPYGTVPYDERVTAMGAKGFIATDGVNVQRYDLGIIDQFEDINQGYFTQCFSQRFDTQNQTWMIYPLESSDPVTPPPQTAILIYNFLENTWAKFNTAVSMSCLGIYFVSSDATWGDFAPGQPLGNKYPNWGVCDFEWDYFLDQNLEPELLGGGSDGIVYLMYQTDADNGQSFFTNISTTQWNPFIEIGEKVQFGYIDFYYTINADSVVQLTFFADNTSSPSSVRTLTLDGPINSDKHMKRIYINVTGEFLRMEIENVTQANFQILGMVLWARPAGRLTP